MSKVEVNEIDKQSGSTLTLGGSGTAVTLACGATQTGFGRTGTVDWQTGSIKTATFTAANGEGYFADTSSGAFTMNLPSATAGNIVSVADYTNTFQTHNLTISPNGSQKIGGVAASTVLSTEGQSVTLVYVDDTEGWKNVQDSTSNVTGNPFLVASGGTETTSGNFKIHTFTGPGTFTVSNTSATAAENIVSYLVVAGGGGGGGRHGGGGGAGGFREYKGPADCYTASPLNGNPCGTAVTVTAQAYPITVGAGGTAGIFRPAPVCSGGVGGNSIFSTITSTGGGGGVSAGQTCGTTITRNGGAGGGGAYNGYTNIPSISPNHVGGSGNTPPVTPAQGFDGGNAQSGSPYAGGGGGGATAAGANAAPGTGGAGATTSITASPVAYAGGGGGGSYIPGGAAGAGGTGGGGAGGPEGNEGSNGTANTGGGAGGTGNDQPGSPACTSPQKGGVGGSGIVVIRYKFQ